MYRIIDIETENTGSDVMQDNKRILSVQIGDDTRQKVPFTTELAQLLQAKIHVIAVNNVKDDKTVNKIQAYITQVAGFMKGKVEYQTEELFGDNIADMVVNYSKGIKADLISIMTEQASGLDLILGNTAHQVINKSDMPVLSLTPREIRISGGTFSTFGG